MSNFKGRVRPNPARDEEMASLFRSGMRCADIGARFNITRAGVSHALRRAGITRTRDEMHAIAALQRGLLLFCVDSCEDIRAAHAKFIAQRERASQRAVGWELTFSDWWGIWLKSGRWAARGRSTGDSAVMARHGDVGPYSSENVYITTLRGNFVDSHLVRGHRVRSDLLTDPVSIFDAPQGYTTRFKNHVAA